MKDLTFERFIPITKVDADQRMVYGYASTPDLDSDGEIIKLDAIKRALPSYLKFPTIREMHQPKPAGTTKQTSIDENGLYIGAKIVADDAWKLVKEGVYKGFSIGGNVVKRMGNIISELDLIEISLVDVPANKKATIELWKQDKGKVNNVILEVLKGMNFADNKIAEEIRKEVIKNMAKEDIEKNAGVADEDTSEETVEETVEEVATEEVAAEEPTEEVAEETTEEVEELDEALGKVEKALDSIEKKEEAKFDLTKSINSIAGTLAKVADTLVTLEGRVAALEKLPAPTKSKAAYVYKNAEDGSGEKEVINANQKTIEKKQARLVELDDLFAKMSRNEFAKAGYAEEAGRLQEEIARLTK